MALRPAVFLDRDGVLNVYLPDEYVRTPEELALIPGAAQAVRRINALGLPVFVISNQQGVAKGLMSQADLEAVDVALREKIAREGDGAAVAASYYCPHSSGANCTCRKPLPGMLLQAAQEHDIDLATSFFVGDTDTDAQAARAAGIGRFIFVLSGKFAHRPEVTTDINRFATPPEHIAADLADAIEWIVTQMGNPVEAAAVVH